MEKEKLEAIKQWTNDPCGAVYAETYKEGSKEFFEAALKNRYEAHAPWLKKMIDELDVEGKTVLEVGCGMGADLLSLARNGAKVIGLDLTPRHIELAKKLFDTFGFPADFIIGDAECMSLPSESVDVVYSFGVLHHTPNIEKAISEIHRVLKPGGLAIVGLYHKNSWHYWVNLVFLQGIFQRKLFKMSIAELLSSSVEFSRSGAKPLVKVYTSSQCKRLFTKFTAVKIKKYQWAKEQIYFPWIFSRITKYLPAFLPSLLG
ncbi:MAG: class I SAM-dependent methyltransferase [Dehalococcoidales bacterium]